MNKPSEDEFEVFIEHVESSLPMWEKTILVCQKNYGKDKWNKQSWENLQAVKKVSEWLQRKIFDEFYCRYEE